MALAVQRAEALCGNALDLDVAQRPGRDRRDDDLGLEPLPLAVVTAQPEGLIRIRSTGVA